jgi:GR25 family glycosyltransferase involved in LPS biosynthesis
MPRIRGRKQGRRNNKKKNRPSAHFRNKEAPYPIEHIYCLNVKERKDRRKQAKKHFDKIGVDVDFFIVKKDDGNPVRGCRTSHIAMLEQARERGYKAILILEDDCILNATLDAIPQQMPDEWSMLYLGGTVTGCHSHEKDFPSSKEDNADTGYPKGRNWVRLRGCLTTHAYIVHEQMYEFLINSLKHTDKPVDVFYADEVHDVDGFPPAWILNPPLASQRTGYSDIEQKNLNYKDLIHEDRYTCYHEVPVITKHDTVTIKKMEIDEDGKEIEVQEEKKVPIQSVNVPSVPDEKLPYVSIVTPTYGRKLFFPLPIYQFLSFDYPPEKLEWVIIDDGYEDLEDILPDDERIKYVKIRGERKMSVSAKRNLAIKYSSHDYIIAMDDDDVYDNSYIRTSINALLWGADKGIECIGTNQIFCYDLINQTSFIRTHHRSELSEATMCFRRRWWEARPFNEKLTHGEGMFFTAHRDYQIAILPSIFTIIAITHRKNVTVDMRSQKHSDKGNNFWNLIPEISRNILLRARHALTKAEEEK